MSFPGFVSAVRRVRPALAEGVVVLERTTSTNDYARRLLELSPLDSHPPPRTLVVAYEQSAGRGRHGQVWWSPPGAGLYASLLLPIEDPHWVPRLPLALGVGLCSSLRDAGATLCGLKWPNDLVVGNRKLGGMLIEIVSPANRTPCAIIGFGINLDGDHETLEDLGATSLNRILEEPPGLIELLRSSVAAVNSALDVMGEGTDLVNRYRDLVVHRLGDELSWRQGNLLVEGRYAGIDSNGFLLLDTEFGREVVSSGEVVER